MTAIKKLVEYLKNVRFDQKSLEGKSKKNHLKYIEICESFIEIEKELIMASYLAGKRIDENYTEFEKNEALKFYEFLSSKYMGD